MRYGAKNILITNPRPFLRLLKLCAKKNLRSWPSVNTLFNALANHPDISKVDFSGVKVCVAGAMALQKAVKEIGCAQPARM